MQVQSLLQEVATQLYNFNIIQEGACNFMIGRILKSFI
jgi:hypothetical protein